MPNTEPIKIYVVSLGCAKNLVDTEVMCGGLATSGFVLTNVEKAADVMLINTCGFIADARSEADQVIRQALRWKRGKKSRRVVVSGCIPQRNLAEAREAYSGVDLFLGLDDVPHAAEQIAGLLDGREQGVRERFNLPRYVYDHTTPRLQLTPRNFAYVKIAEGCDHHCRFCAIPKIRGRFRSRPIESIAEECRMLLEQGVRELNLIAQDTTRFGADLAGDLGLADLLRTLDELPGEFWIRVLYTHPRHFTGEVVAAFAECRHVVPYIDIPLQHISDPMLKAMGRGMGSAETRQLMDRLRADIAGLAVRTTFLVGYPGETDADFAELREFMEHYRFDRLGVFVFSPEEGTPAAAIEHGLVPYDVAERRRGILLEVQQQIALARNQEMIGKTVQVVVEGQEGEGGYVGRSYADAPDVDNLVHFESTFDAVDAGLVPVHIRKADIYDLSGVACR